MRRKCKLDMSNIRETRTLGHIFRECALRKNLLKKCLAEKSIAYTHGKLAGNVWQST